MDKRWLVVWVVAVLMGVVNGINSAQDLFFLVDQSGSMDDADRDCKRLNNGLTCMEVLADFVNKTRTRIGEMIGSYFETPEKNGMRIGIAMFKCKSEGRDPKILLEPTGNLTLIAEGIEKLFLQRAKGYTCAETGLRALDKWIEEQAPLEPPPRTTSILYVTDGKLENGDRPYSRQVAEAIRARNRTKIFGLSIGESASQINQISEITGDAGLIFNVKDPASLPDVIEALASYIFGDFRAVIGNTTNGVPCLGERPSVVVTGLSVATLDNVFCEFIINGLNNEDTPITTLGVRDGPGFVCQFPESFYGYGEDEIVKVDLFTRVSDTLVRRLGTTSTFVLSRPTCINVTNTGTGTRCLGDSSQYQLTGKTIQAFLQSQEVYTFECLFQMIENGFNFTIAMPGADISDGTGIRCALPDQSASRFYSEDVDPNSTEVLDVGGTDYFVVPPPILGRIDVRITRTTTNDIPGTPTRTINLVDIAQPPSDLKLNDPLCLAGTVSTSTCWRHPDGADASFTGPVISNFMKKEDGRVQLSCLIADRDVNEGFLINRAKVSDNTVSCDMPESFAEPRADGSNTRQLRTSLYLIDSQTKRAMKVTEQFDNTFTFTLLPCFSASGKAEVCFGEATTIQLSPDTAEQSIDLATAPGVKCRFEDTNNHEVRFDQPVVSQANGGGYVCSSPPVTGQNFGLTFNRFDLLSYDRSVLSRIKDTSITSDCFEVLARDRPNQVYRTVTGENDLIGCWGNVASDPKDRSVLFKGETVELLKNDQISCQFTGENATSVSYDETLGGFVCFVPDELFTSQLPEEFAVKLSITGDIPGNGTVTRVLVNQRLGLVVKPCIDTEVTTVSPPGATPCMGTQLQVSLAGESLQPYLDKIGNRDLMKCVYGARYNNYISNATFPNATSNSPATCLFPEYASFPSRRVFEIRLPLPNNQYLNVPVSKYTIHKADECFQEPAVKVEPQGTTANDNNNTLRRVLQREGQEYCLGDGMEVGFNGQSVEIMKQKFGMNALKCMWQPDSDWVTDPSDQVAIQGDAPYMVNGSDTVWCKSKRWNPFNASEVNYGVYANVSLVVEFMASGNITQDVVGDTKRLDSPQYKATACADGKDWALPAGREKCQRGTIDLTLSGRTAYTLSQKVDRLRCAFANGDLNKTVPITAATSEYVYCSHTGWRPATNGTNNDELNGNFTSLAIIVLMDNDQPKVVKKVDFDPTAGEPCFDISLNDRPCVGDSVDLSIGGPTLGSYNLWANETLNQSLSDLVRCNNATVSGSGDTELSCNILEKFLPSSNTGETVDVDFAVVNTNLVQPILHRLLARRISIADRSGNCFNTDYSMAKCSGNQMGSTVEMSGPTARNVDPSQLTCLFRNKTTGTTESAPMEAITGNPNTPSLITCTARKGYDSFDIFFADQIGVGFDYPIQLDNNTCIVGAVAPSPSPSPDGGSNLGMILGIVFGLLFLIGLIAFFILRKKRKDDDEEEDNDLERGEAVSEQDVEPVMVGKVDEKAIMDPAADELPQFSPGDRVEAFGEFDATSIGHGSAWFKGTISQANGDGTYAIDFDHMQHADAKSMEEINVNAVHASQIRLASSDFKVGQIVECRHAGGPTWYTALIEKVNTNNTYSVSYNDDTLESEENVPAEYIREAIMIFQTGSVVEFKDAAVANKFSKGVVMGMNINEETYEIKADDGTEHPAVKASDVRAFVTHVGDVVLVTKPEFDGIGKRAVVTSVNLEQQTCTVEYDDPEENKKSADAPVPWTQISRFTLSIGDAVEVLTNCKWENFGKVTEANYETAHYSVRYDAESLGEESNIPVERIRIAPKIPPTKPELTDEEFFAKYAFRPPPREHDADSMKVPKHLRFRRKRPINFQELPNNRFAITLDISNGLGLSLGWTNDNRVIVAGFRDLPSGTWGPVEASGVVGLKDQLLAVNENDISGKSFVEVSELIKSSGKTIKLEFGRWDDDEAVTLAAPPANSPTA